MANPTIPPFFENPWNTKTNSYGVCWQRWLTAVGQASVGGQLPATNTNDSAGAGLLGEFISTTAGVGSAVTLSSGVAKTVLSISLTPGDWDVSGALNLHLANSTVLSFVQGGSSSTANTLNGQDSYFSLPLAYATVAPDLALPLPVYRRSLAAATTIYLIADVTFSSGGLSAYGTLQARRAR